MLKGTTHSEETKRKMSKARKRIISLGFVYKVWHHSAEAKKKISLAGKGKKKSQQMRERLSASRKGSKHPLWKGGKQISYGYVYLLRPKHLFAQKRGYILRSHLVMEKKLGRYLKPCEVVHHKGIRYPLDSIENKQDDRPENLRLFPNSSAHTKFHRLMR